MDGATVYKTLTKGIDKIYIGATSLPGELLLTNSNNVPVVVNETGQVLVAATTYGLGKILALTHDRYLQTESFRKLILNSIGWMTSGKAASSVTVGMQEWLSEFGGFLTSEGYNSDFSDNIDSSIDVFCCRSYDHIENLDGFKNFVHNGGGLIIAGQAWHFASLGISQDLMDFPEKEMKSGTYMATRYLQLQHDDKKGKTFGSSRDKSPDTSYLVPQIHKFPGPGQVSYIIFSV